MQERSGDISENITRGGEYDVRDYDAEATHKDYLIGGISYIEANAARPGAGDQVPKRVLAPLAGQAGS